MTPFVRRSLWLFGVLLLAVLLFLGWLLYTESGRDFALGFAAVVPAVDATPAA